MKVIQIQLFGGRIDTMKFALNLAIKHFENINQHDMSLIYRDMLAEIEKKESTE